MFRMNRVIGAGVALALPLMGHAESSISFVSLADGAQGLLYEPARSEQDAGIGIVFMHSYSSELDSPACDSLAERDYRILCADSRFTNNDLGYKGFEDHAPAIRSAIEYMRGLDGIEKVVLLGHSMGAPMMAFYQNVAENGPSACQDETKIMPCDPEDLEDLPAADAIILLDPHFGEAFGALTYADPAVTDPQRPRVRDQALDMFDAGNGYSKDGAHYSEEFRSSFFKAQAARNAALIADAREQWEELQAAGETQYENAPFFVPGARARLLQPDTDLMQKSKSPHLLLKGDGTESREILSSVRVPSGGASRANSFAGSLPTNLRSFLGNYSIRTTEDYAVTADDVTGVDWDSSATSTISNAKGITVPMLVMVMTGHYFIRSGEMVLESAASDDKELVGVEGATHGFTPCKPCAKAEGEFGDTVGRLFDYVDGWLMEHV